MLAAAASRLGCASAAPSVAGEQKRPVAAQQQERPPTCTAGITFVVEPGIEPAGPGSYGAEQNSWRYRERDEGDSLKAAWQKMGRVEAMSPAPAGTVATFTRQNMLAKAVHAAFFGHHPLILSPDVIWLTIAQGLANHVDQNAEALRSSFVTHEGKEKIEVAREDFVLGSGSNDWEGVFPEFSAKIRARTVPGTAELVESDFSTTGPVERIVSHITLMDTVQHYFSYSMSCGCGFPSITLSGTPADWEKIRAKAEELRKYDLDWWLAALLPALDQFVAAAHGKPDLDFWRSLCNIATSSSYTVYHPLTGWIQAFFPYLNATVYEGRGLGQFAEAEDGQAKKAMVRNNSLSNYEESVRNSLTLANFDPGGVGPGAPRFMKDESGARQHFPTPQEGVKHTKAGVKLELFPPVRFSDSIPELRNLRNLRKDLFASCCLRLICIRCFAGDVLGAVCHERPADREQAQPGILRRVDDPRATCGWLNRAEGWLGSAGRYADVRRQRRR